MSGSCLDLTIPLQPGEEAVAFLSRLAARNGIPSVRAFCADMDLALAGIVEGRGPDLARLANLAGVDEVALQAASIRKESHAFRVRDERMVAASLRRNRFVVCPACLDADIAASGLRPHVASYGRLAWRIEAVRTCSVHHMAFVELDDGRGVTRHDFAAMVRPHLKRLDELSRNAPMRPTTELERYVMCRLDRCRRDAPFLDGLELHVAIRLCEVIGALSIHGRGVHLTRLSDDDLRFGGAVGIGIAGEGEDGVIAFLKDLQRAYPYGRRARASPRTPFAEFRAWFAAHARHPSYASVRSLLIRHLADEKPIDIPDKRYGPILERTAHDYARLMNGRPRIIRAKPMPLSTGAPVVSHSSAKLESSHTITAMHSQDAIRKLSCGVPLFQAMVAHGLVAPVQGIHEPAWRLFFGEGDLDAFLDALVGGGGSRKEREDEVVGIHDAADLTLCAPVEIVRLILGRRLTWVGRRPGEVGLGSILVRLEEVRKLVQTQAIEGPTLAEAAAFLRCEPEWIDALIVMGALSKEAGIFAHTGSPVECVTAPSVDLFQALHIEVRSIRTVNRMNVDEAIAFLEASGLEVAYADERLGFTFFDRQAVASLNPGLDLRLPLPWTKGFYRSREWLERSKPPRT